MSTQDKMALIDRLQKEFPNSTLSALDEFRTTKEFIPTGSMVLDRALGCMGLPLGRIVELVGVESSGKTSIANSVIANAQRRGYDALLVDAEFAYNKEFAQEMYGVDPSRLYIAQPASAEDGMGILEAYIEAGAVNVIVYDSIASLVGEEELEKGFEDPEKIGNHAKMVTRMIKRIVPRCGAKDILFIAINQLRDQIGYAPIETGGKGLRCWKSISIHMKPGDKIEEQGEIVGRKSEFTVKKNKLGAPLTQGSFTIRWGNEPKGIDNISDVMDLAIAGKVIQAKKGWYGYGDLNMRLRDLRDFFLSSPDEFDELMKLTGVA